MNIFEYVMQKALQKVEQKTGWKYGEPHSYISYILPVVGIVFCISMAVFVVCFTIGVFGGSIGPAAHAGIVISASGFAVLLPSAIIIASIKYLIETDVRNIKW